MSLVEQQYLQSYKAESSMQSEILSFKTVSLMPTKTAHRDYNELLPGFVTSQTQINPAPWEHTEKEAGPCSADLEKRKRKRKNLFIYESRFCLLMDSQINMF